MNFYWINLARKQLLYIDLCYCLKFGHTGLNSALIQLHFHHHNNIKLSKYFFWLLKLLFISVKTNYIVPFGVYRLSHHVIEANQPMKTVFLFFYLLFFQILHALRRSSIEYTELS